MKREQISILGCKIGKKITMNYFHIAESKNYNVENDDTPHPDLIKALHAFNDDLAEAFHVDSNNVDNYKATGFTIHEKKGNYFIILSGKVQTSHDAVVGISSGHIPYNANGDIINNVMEEKLLDIREALFQYMFEGVGAQQTIPFPEENKEESSSKKKK